MRGRIVLELGGQWPTQLAFFPLGFGPGDDAERVVRVNLDGSFAADVLVGEYRVEMRSPPGPWKISAVRRDGRGLTSVVVGEGEIVDGLEVAVAGR